MNLKKPYFNVLSANRPGFTLVELLAVVLIIAVLATLAVLGVSAMIAAAEFRFAGSDTVALMRQASMTAANNHKPVRVALDCRPTVGNPSVGCNLQLDIAQFEVVTVAGRADEIAFVEWRKLVRFSQELPAHVEVVGGDEGDMGTPPPDVLLAVFYPSGKVLISQAFPWVFTSSRFSGDDINISVNTTTGLAKSSRD